MSNVLHLKPNPSTEKKRLNQAVAEDIHPRERQYSIRDTEHDGFLIRVQPTGNASWASELRVKGGKTIRVTHGRTTSLSFEEALELHLKTKHQTDQGIDPREERRRKATQQMTWSRLFEQYVSDRKSAGKLRDSTIRLYRSLMDRPLSQFKEKRVASTTGKTFTKTYLSMHDRQAQANQCLRLVSSLHSYGKAMELLPPESEDPTNMVRAAGLKYKDASNLENTLYPPQLAELLAAVFIESDVEGSFSRTSRDAIVMLALTGWRKEDVLQLRWSQIDWKHKTIDFKGTKTSSQATPMTPVTERLLRHRHRHTDSEFVFPSVRATHKPLRNVQPAITRATKRTGREKPISPQGLRRSFTTLLRHLDTLNDVQRALVGHSVGNDIELKHYQLTHISKLREAATDAHHYLSGIIPLDGLFSVAGETPVATSRTLGYLLYPEEGDDPSDAYAPDLSDPYDSEHS